MSTAQPSCRIAGPFHICFLVDDLEVAMPSFEQSLGVTFRPPARLRVTGWSDPADPDCQEATPRVTYSSEGPPYIELMEAFGHGVFSSERGEGFHHLGVWTNGNEECRIMLDALGIKSAARASNADGSTSVWFNAPASLHGARIEYCEEEIARQMLDAWRG